MRARLDAGNTGSPITPVSSIVTDFRVDDIVSCAARQFGDQWAHTHYGTKWRTTRVQGRVLGDMGHKMFKVQCVGDPEPMDSGAKTLQLGKHADTSDDDGDTEPYVPSDDEATLSDGNF